MKIHLKFACVPLVGEWHFFHCYSSKTKCFSIIAWKVFAHAWHNRQMKFLNVCWLFFACILQLIIPKSGLNVAARNCHYHTRLRFNRLLNKQFKCKQMQSMSANSRLFFFAFSRVSFQRQNFQIQHLNSIYFCDSLKFNWYFAFGRYVART